MGDRITTDINGRKHIVKESAHDKLFSRAINEHNRLTKSTPVMSNAELQEAINVLLSAQSSIPNDALKELLDEQVRRSKLIAIMG